MISKYLAKKQYVLMQLDGGDVTSGGLRELVPCIARRAVAVGVDGIFMEVGYNFFDTTQEQRVLLNILSSCLNLIMIRFMMIIKMLR